MEKLFHIPYVDDYFHRNRKSKWHVEACDCLSPQPTALEICHKH